MDEKRKVLIWLGGGQVTDIGINLEKYDEVIFIDALKHICWELESFISQRNINGFVINGAVSKSAITATFNETSDSDYSFLEGYEVKTPGNVSVVDSLTVQTMGFSDVLSLVDLAKSSLTIVCSISSLTHFLSEHVLSNTEDGSVDEFFLLQQDCKTTVGIDDGFFKLMESHFYVRKAPLKCSSSEYFSHYCFSNAKFKSALRDKAEKALKFENESLKNKLSQKEKEYELLLENFESFKNKSAIQMEEILQQAKVIENKQVDILTKMSEGIVEKLPSLDSQIKTVTESARDYNARTMATIQDSINTVLEKMEVAAKQTNDSLTNVIDTAASRLIEKLDSTEKNTKALVSSSHTNTIKQIEDFSSVRNFIDSGQKPLNFHGWPISPDIAVRIVTMLSTAQYNGVLEFGSGTSTALIGRIIKRLIQDDVYEKPIPFFSFDHNEMYFERTKELLRAHDVLEFVTLNHCELVKERFNDTDFRYYDCRDVINSFGKLFNNIKPKLLVLVDGPPGATNPHARYPALPIILQQINQDEFDLDFLVDDYNRREEKEVVERWKQDAENAGLSSENEVVPSEKGFSIFSVRCKK